MRGCRRTPRCATFCEFVLRLASRGPEAFATLCEFVAKWILDAELANHGPQKPVIGDAV